MAGRDSYDDADDGRVRELEIEVKALERTVEYLLNNWLAWDVNRAEIARRVARQHARYRAALRGDLT